MPAAGDIQVRVGLDALCFAREGEESAEVSVPRPVWAGAWDRLRQGAGAWEWRDARTGAKLVIQTNGQGEATLTLEAARPA
jgi:hypothetical protein